MATVPESSEEQVVISRERAQQAKFASRRKKSLALAALSGLLCLALLAFGLWVFAICALFISLIGVSNYFAANGHLHYLQKREKHRKRLARDFSKLEPDVPRGRGSRDTNPSGVPTPAG
jgi:hypothetical protein